uniref:CG-1 domain-containing protein n=1 Tax=Kalanchoe fedtschenkoi TaxID=63787 RepID=A0A7N1A5B5_KALFE
MQSEFDISDLVREAQARWLKPAEVYYIILNCDDSQLLSESAKNPASGSLFLYNKRVLRNFRKDGHNWRKKRDGRTVGEAHERLKVGNVEALNCYYAHGEENPSFQRRSFWMLTGERGHIVLVQYLDVANQSPGSVSQPSHLFSSPSSHSPSSSSGTNQESVSFGGGYESQINLPSPVSSEICSEVGIDNSMLDYYNSLRNASETMTVSNDSNVKVNEALRRIEEQLSLNDENVNEINSIRSPDGKLNISNFEDFPMEIAYQGQPDDFLDGSEYAARDRGCAGVKNGFNSVMHEAGDSGMSRQQTSSHKEPSGDRDSVSWTDMVDFGEGEHLSPNLPEVFSPSTNRFEGPPFSSFTSSQQRDLGYSFDTDQTTIPPQVQKQKFTILDVSPEWGYSFETTKVIIVGSFLCHPSEHAWTCMFGDIEVPIQIIQEGVILCEAPPNPSGKVTICITSANHEPCSEVREFEYRNKTSSCSQCSARKEETTMSSEELLLLVRLAQMLLCDTLGQRGDSKEQGNALSEKRNFNEDSWSLIVESLLVGSGTSSGTMKWLLEEFLKDKLVKWLSSKTHNRLGESSCLLSRKEQGVIHMIAGLGYEWALTPIISSGVSINFRDINGWTALHWAARFGREKMVACLIASGALAGAVTDPNAQDPTGKTPASIAAINGHKGLAGYLSEVSLTSHLSSLKLQESEFSKGLAVLEAEHTINRISENNMHTSEDQLSLKDTLTAVRNAASAAARIQSAYRAHSFRKRQQKNAFNTVSIDDYGFSSGELQGLPSVSKIAFRNTRDHNSAALSIQKKYKGYKGRKEFLDFRQKVVKIQAHVRGHQTRKNYKVCWAVGILEKIVLRWRRKGVGLRGFKPEPETIDESDEEDFAKVFRKKKVEAAVDEAVSRVLSMVESSEARQQYRRMLERYRQAKAQLGNAANEEASGSLTGMSNMEDDQTFQYSFSLDHY